MNRTCSGKLLVHPLRCHLIGLLKKLDDHDCHPSLKYEIEIIIFDLEMLDMGVKP